MTTKNSKKRLNLFISPVLYSFLQEDAEIESKPVTQKALSIIEQYYKERLNAMQTKIFQETKERTSDLMLGYFDNEKKIAEIVKEVIAQM